MADIKISALIDGGESLATDDVLVNRGGTNRRVRPPLPFGPYATLSALAAAKPPTAALAGRTGFYGSGAPYSFARCDGAAWLDNAGVVLNLATEAVTTNKVLAAGDNGKTFDLQNPGLTISVPPGLGNTFRFSLMLNGENNTVQGTGGVTVDGVTAPVVYAASVSRMLSVISRAVADTYLASRAGTTVSSDTDVTAWVARVTAAGGTVSTPVQNAAINLVTAWKSAGVWSLIRRMNLMVGDFLAMPIPLVNTAGSAADALVNLVTGDYSEALGWAGDGTTKYINTGYTQIAGDPTGGFGGILRTAPTADANVRALMGASGASSGFRLAMNAASNLSASAGAVYSKFTGSNGTAGISVAGAAGAGIFHSMRRSVTDHAVYKNGAPIGTQVLSLSHLTPGQAYYVGASNEQGTPGYFMESGVRMAGHWVTAAMTDAQVAAFTSPLQTFNTAIGRAL